MFVRDYDAQSEGNHDVKKMRMYSIQCCLTFYIGSIPWMVSKRLRCQFSQRYETIMSLQVEYPQ